MLQQQSVSSSENGKYSALSLIAILILFILLPRSVFAWQGKVVHVSDGDTITVLHEGLEEKIRLYGVDTPEKGQAFGQKAKDFTANMVAGRLVDVQREDTDRYGRTVAIVSIAGKCLNEELVKAGYAWQYRKYCKESFCRRWLEFETTARQNKLGLFADPDAIAPWDWRKNR